MNAFQRGFIKRAFELPKPELDLATTPKAPQFDFSKMMDSARKPLDLLTTKTRNVADYGLGKWDQISDKLQGTNSWQLPPNPIHKYTNELAQVGGAGQAANRYVSNNIQNVLTNSVDPWKAEHPQLASADTQIAEQIRKVTDEARGALQSTNGPHVFTNRVAYPSVEPLKLPDNLVASQNTTQKAINPVLAAAQGWDATKMDALSKVSPAYGAFKELERTVGHEAAVRVMRETSPEFNNLYGAKDQLAQYGATPWWKRALGTHFNRPNLTPEQAATSQELLNRPEPNELAWQQVKEHPFRTAANLPNEIANPGTYGTLLEGAGTLTSALGTGNIARAAGNTMRVAGQAGVAGSLLLNTGFEMPHLGREVGKYRYEDGLPWRQAVGNYFDDRLRHSQHTQKPLARMQEYMDNMFHPVRTIGAAAQAGPKAWWDVLRPNPSKLPTADTAQSGYSPTW